MPAYIIAIRERLHDKAPLESYAAVAATAPREALTPRARYGHVEVLEGPGCDGVSMVEFPTIEAARAWYDSPEYSKARTFRRQAGDYRVLLVEGLDADAEEKRNA